MRTYRGEIYQTDFNLNSYEGKINKFLEVCNLKFMTFNEIRLNIKNLPQKKVSFAVKTLEINRVCICIDCETLYNHWKNGVTIDEIDKLHLSKLLKRNPKTTILVNSYPFLSKQFDFSKNYNYRLWDDYFDVLKEKKFLF